MIFIIFIILVAIGIAITTFLQAWYVLIPLVVLLLIGIGWRITRRSEGYRLEARGAPRNRGGRRRVPCDPNYVSQRNFYCGNGAVPARYARRGTRYECFQTGIGTGKCRINRPPHDPSYVPQKTIFCGKTNDINTIRQKGYQSAGTPYQCLKKGYGVGMYMELPAELYV